MSKVGSLKTEIEKTYLQLKNRGDKKMCCGFRGRMRRRVISLKQAFLIEKRTGRSEFSEEELAVFEEKIRELASIFRVKFGGNDESKK
jgi:hypothetical protein